MKIHSSSLTFPRAGINQTSAEINGAQNNGPVVTNNTPDAASNQPSTPEQIKNALANTNPATSYNSDNIIKPTDSRTLKALSAYTKQFNAPLQDQRAQLITGIDAYA